MLKNKWLMGGLLAVCMLLSACGKTQTAEKPLLTGVLMDSQQTNYNTETVQRTDWVIEQANSAAVLFPRTTTFVWENGDAVFQESFVSRNAVVKKGDVLMSFVVEEDYVAMQELQLQLKRTTEAYSGDRKIKEAAIANAKKAMEDLTSHSLTIAQQELEKLQADYEQFVYNSEKSIQNIQEQIAEINERVADNQIIAPHDGIVTNLSYYAKGDDVENGEVLLSLYDTNYLYLRVNDAGYKLRYGMEVSVDVSLGKEVVTLPAKVVSTPAILPWETEQNYTLMEMDLSSLSEEVYDQALKNIGKCAFQYSCITFEVKDVLLISKQAVHTDEEKKNFVYVLENDLVCKRYISVGAQNNGMIWVIDGLSEGQVLVLD